MSILSGFFAIFGAWLAIHSLGARAKAAEVRTSWRETPATVLSREAKSHRSYDKQRKEWREDRWKEVAYAYEIDGRRYVGNGVDPFAGARLPEAMSYAPGQALRCWVDPAAPGESYLDADVPAVGVFLVFSGVLILAALILLAVVWWPPKADAGPGA